MGTVFTLASLRDEMEAKYGTVTIDLGDEKIDLRPFMTLPDADLATVTRILGEVGDADFTKDPEKMLSLLDDALAVATGSADKAGRLVAALGSSIGARQLLVMKWQKGSDAGEASPSRD